MTNRNRLLGAMLLPLAVVTILIALNSTDVAAQNAQPPAGVEAPVAQDGRPAGAASKAAPKPAPLNTFWWVIKSSGFIGAIILGLSIYFVATIVRLFIELRQEVAMPPEEVAQCEEFFQARNYQGP